MQITPINFFNRILVPCFLMIVCPLAVILLVYTATNLNGSITQLANVFYVNGFFTTVWNIWHPVFFGTPTAWLIIGIFAILQLLLMRIVPGKIFHGPLTEKGNTPIYKDNGFACFLITIGLFLLTSYGLHWFNPAIAYDNIVAIIGALNIFSLAFCLFLYFKGLLAPSSSDSGSSGNFIFDYYWGMELYPQILGWNIKQFTNCRFGMMAWPVLLLSYGAKQTELFAHMSSAMWVAIIIQMVYISKFFLWETGYLCSIDIMLDRAGFYICWGCLVWVPGFYTLPTMYLVLHPNELSPVLAATILIVGVGSVIINYLADRQRQLFRKTHGQCKIWGKQPNTIVAEYTDAHGIKKQSLLLASGWWSLARHFHYTPEILGAFCWSVPALFMNTMPYFYVVFLTVLLAHRAYRDELKCSKKYGIYWQEYCKRVPSLVIPGLTLKFTGKN